MHRSGKCGASAQKAKGLCSNPDSASFETVDHCLPSLRE